MDSYNILFTDTLWKKCNISEDECVLAGISGGIDSMFLLSLFIDTAHPVVAAVFDHGLRPEAADECDFVEKFCEEHGIRCIRGAGDVQTYAAENKLGIEEAARKLRYRFLFQAAAENDCKAVAVAHHANDQAETVLMHVLRGSGIDGLCGMRPYSLPNAFSDEIPLIRPLLLITRDEIEEYAAKNGMPYCEDRSNSGMGYFRNRIRLDLMPKLAAEYNPQIISSLCRLAENVAVEKEMLDDNCEKAIRYAACYQFETCCEWNRKTYRSYPTGLRCRMLRRILSMMGADLSEIGYQQILLADQFLMTARYNQTFPLVKGYWVCCEGDKALFLTEPDREQWKYPQMSQGWTLYCETRHISEKDLPEWIEKARKHPEIAILDADQVAFYPSLRAIRPGDRFQPYGISGSQKLSDFLINNKVPVQYRRDLVVAADEAGIVWVPGQRVSNRCALHDKTRRIMILKLKKRTREEE